MFLSSLTHGEGMKELTFLTNRRALFISFDQSQAWKSKSNRSSLASSCVRSHLSTVTCQSAPRFQSLIQRRFVPFYYYKHCLKYGSYANMRGSKSDITVIQYFFLIFLLFVHKSCQLTKQGQLTSLCIINYVSASSISQLSCIILHILFCSL